MSKRPAGIRVLAVLLMLGAMGLSIQQYLLYKQLSGNAQLQFSILLTVIWLSVTSIGLWKGKRWAWWLCGLYFTDSVLRQLNLSLILSNVVPAEAELSYFYVKYLGWALINALLIGYLFRPVVSAFFEFETGKQTIRLLRLLALGMLIFSAQMMWG